MQEAEKAEISAVSEIVYRRSSIVEKIPAEKIPKDKYQICYMVFFFLGILHFLPPSFLSAANNFWLFKFRNISNTNTSDISNNRTVLQSNFASAQTVVNTILSILCGYLNVVYGNRLKIVPRIVGALVVIAMIFAILTIFVKINTDEYQVEFLALALLCSGAITGANSVSILTSTLLYPRFPHRYMKICLIGEGVSAIIVDLLNIVSVSIFDDLTDATLMYFIVGTILITATLTLFAAVSRNTFFKYCLATIPESNKNRRHTTKKQIAHSVKKIWPSIIIFFIFGLSTAATHTSVTSLVVSEYTNEWGKKFFSPVITFLLSDIWLLIGKIISSFGPWQIPEKILCVLALARSVVLVPAIWLCHAVSQNRRLPFVFWHDWEYSLILGSFTFSNGYLINTAVLNIPKNTSKEESEVAFTVFTIFMGLAQVVASPIGLFIVNIL